MAVEFNKPNQNFVKIIRDFPDAKAVVFHGKTISRLAVYLNPTASCRSGQPNSYMDRHFSACYAYHKNNETSFRPASRTNFKTNKILGPTFFKIP